MRKSFLAAGLIAVVLTLGLGFGYAQTIPSGYAHGGWYCPWHNHVSGGGYTRQTAGAWRCSLAGYGQRHAWDRGSGMMQHRGCMGYGMEYHGWRRGASYGSGYGSPVARDGLR